MKSQVGKLSKNIFVYSLIAYPMILFAIFYIGVNGNSILMAFKTVEKGEVVFAGLLNFKNVFEKISTDSLFYISIMNSFKMTLICFIVSNPLYFICAYYIYKKRFGSKTLRFLILLPNIISNMIMVLVFKRVLEDVLPSAFGTGFPDLLKDAKFAFGTQVFFNIWLSFSGNVIIYPNAMNTISPEVIESSKLDGVNMFQEFCYIIFPYIFPTFSTYLITNIAGMFANPYSLYTFFGWDQCPESAYTMGYYLSRTVMKNQNSNVQLSFAAALGLTITFVSAPVTLLVRRLLEKYGPSED